MEDDNELELELKHQEQEMKDSLVEKHFNPSLREKLGGASRVVEQEDSLSESHPSSKEGGDLDVHMIDLFNEEGGGGGGEQTEAPRKRLKKRKTAPSPADDDVFDDFAEKKIVLPESEDTLAHQEEKDAIQLFFTSKAVKNPSGDSRIKVSVSSKQEIDLRLFLQDFVIIWNGTWTEQPENGLLETFFTCSPEDKQACIDKLSLHKVSLETLCGNEKQQEEEEEEEEEQSQQPSPLSFVTKLVKNASTGLPRAKITVTASGDFILPDIQEDVLIDDIQGVVWKKGSWTPERTTFFTCDPSNRRDCEERIVGYRPPRPAPFTLILKPVKNKKDEARIKISILMNDSRKTFDIRPLLKGLKGIVWNLEWLTDGSTFFTCQPDDAPECQKRLLACDFRDAHSEQREMDQLKHKLARRHRDKPLSIERTPGIFNAAEVSLKDQFKAYLTVKWRIMTDPHYKALYNYVVEYRKKNAVIVAPATKEFSKEEIIQLVDDNAIASHVIQQRRNCIDLVFDYQNKRNLAEGTKLLQMLAQFAGFTDYSIEEFSKKPDNGGQPLDPCYITGKPIRNSLAYIIRVTTAKHPDGLLFFLCDQWQTIIKPALVIVHHDAVLALNLAQVSTLEELLSDEILLREFKLLRTSFIFFYKMLENTALAKQFFIKVDRRWIE